ncbi:MAG: TetR family transcriptional regulator [Actinobacteria bacterium]|nr:TetR family transcriptional regulator [Actinomycetota bacterium]
MSNDASRMGRRDALANRERIIESALAVIEREGFDVPVASIAAEAGVGIGTFYRGFSDRAALMRELQLRAYDALIGILEEIKDRGETGLSAIESYLRSALAISHRLILPLHGVQPLVDPDAVMRRERINTDLERFMVAGAAGGVGFTVAQLLVDAGVTVIGTAAERDHEALKAYGIHPVSYGDGVADAIRTAAPDGVAAFLDTHGDGQADIAIALGVKPDRIDSIIDFGSGKRLGIRNVGMYQLDDIRSAVVEFAGLVAAGKVALPVKARFPLAHVQDAYRAIGGPGLGKVVLDIDGV